MEGLQGRRERRKRPLEEAERQGTTIDLVHLRHDRDVASPEQPDVQPQGLWCRLHQRLPLPSVSPAGSTPRPRRGAGLWSLADHTVESTVECTAARGGLIDTVIMIIWVRKCVSFAEEREADHFRGKYRATA
jgi:hypothetical protein